MEVKKINYQEKLIQFLDNNDIDTGTTIDDDYIILVDDYKKYGLIEKIHELSNNMVSKGHKLNAFLEYFYKFTNIDEILQYKESWVLCHECGRYAYNPDYGIRNQFYIDNLKSEYICKNCMNSSDYIDNLINDKNNCNILLSDGNIEDEGYSILNEYNFKVDMYGGINFDKKQFQEDMKKLEVDFFYYLYNTHMFGTYFTICVKNEDLEKTKIFLTSSKYSNFRSN